MGGKIGGFLKKIGGAIAHPVKTVKTSARKKAVATVLAIGLGFVGLGYISPESQEAVVDAIVSIWNDVEQQMEQEQQNIQDTETQEVEETETQER